MSSSWATLCLASCFSLVSSTFVTVEVQHGAEVTLQCSHSSSLIGRISWFHMSDQFNISQICSMNDPKGNVAFHSPAPGEKYAMTSNMSTLCLTVKKVDSSDGGLYFCGEKTKEKTVIFTATYLKIQVENVSWYSTNFPILIMAGIISLLVLLVGGLLLKIHKLLKGRTQEVCLEQQEENAESTELTYATVNFRAQRRPSNKDPQPSVVYDATR